MDKKILELQKVIEENPNKISQLSDIELMAVNSLYDQQIEELDRQINKQKENFKKLIRMVENK